MTVAAGNDAPRVFKHINQEDLLRIVGEVDESAFVQTPLEAQQQFCSREAISHVTRDLEVTLDGAKNKVRHYTGCRDAAWTQEQLEAWIRFEDLLFKQLWHRLIPEDEALPECDRRTPVR